MKKILLTLLCAVLLTSPCRAITPLEEDALDLASSSAVLIEKSTGELIYEKNAFEHLSPASVTKVMTMLLIVEEIDRGTLYLDDMVTASARASSMGGSQVWLKEGEQMSVSDMLKCIAVVSANDCCVAMAEHLSGSEDLFVAKMNQRAKELGMENTNFTCCSGLLEDESHYSCARDIAIMSRELLKHELIKDFTTVWMDSIRGGEFQLSNTNKLIYYYDGATGLKTGFTSKAMFCLSASAERNGVEYIAVVLHAPSSQERFEDAKTLLNYAFSNYTLTYPQSIAALPPVKVELGKYSSVQPLLPDDCATLTEKSTGSNISCEIELPESIKAPVKEGQVLGYMKLLCDGETVRELELRADSNVDRLSTLDIFKTLLMSMLGAC